MPLFVVGGGLLDVFGVFFEAVWLAFAEEAVGGENAKDKAWAGADEGVEEDKEEDLEDGGDDRNRVRHRMV